MDISVKVASAGSDAGRPDDALTATARELGLDLRPMHPGIDDPVLSTYYTADAGDDRAAAEAAARRLNELDAVEGAYVSPTPEPAPEQGGH